MIVGHSAVAFGVVAGGGAVRGWSRGRALRAGAAAAAFAAVPDVDMVYGLAVVAAVEGGTPAAVIDAFWTATSRIHRLATHFLLTGAVATVGFAAVAAGVHEAGEAGGEAGAGTRASAAVRLAAGLAVLGALAAWVFDRFAAVDALVIAVYAAVGAAVAAVAVRRAGLDARTVLVAAAVGLLSHPFGDLFTGQPPALFSPLTVAFPSEPLLLHPDPTLAFLAVFGLELTTVWFALAAYRAQTGRPTRRDLDARALVGVPYALAALVAPVPPPLVGYYPTFSLLATGGLGVLVVRPARSVRRLAAGTRPAGADLLRVATTGLAAVTLATATYALGYLVAG